ncbi:hypothetical protein J9303_00325 [Bacillaceae bacterium Marseille-Q3522]|nr:hypothetical protein [Bacillaceae bacterium Marseille-Q3522]
MTAGEMLAYQTRLKAILKSKLSQAQKDRRLASLMSDLETGYSIPMLRNEKFEAENPFVMMLYKTVSEARSI